MARQKGYAVIVTNTNDNRRTIDKQKKFIQVLNDDSCLKNHQHYVTHSLRTFDREVKIQ